MNEGGLLVWQKATPVLSLLFGCLKEYLKGGKAYIPETGTGLLTMFIDASEEGIHPSLKRSSFSPAEDTERGASLLQRVPDLSCGSRGFPVSSGQGLVREKGVAHLQNLQPS